MLDTEVLVTVNRPLCLENQFWRDLQMGFCENDNVTSFKDCAWKKETWSPARERETESRQRVSV